jgi:D-glycero-alpha-D-manno-heptose 1-phosphate guanylyltransferase
MSAHVGSAVILAGGLGTRLHKVVPDVPKPMAPVNGRPFLEHQLDFWIDQGISQFVLSVGYRREVIIEHFGTSYRNARIDYAIEESPLGTGGGLLLAVDKLVDQRSFLLLNGDTFFEVALAKLSSLHSSKQSDWTISLFSTGDTGRYMGLDMAADGRILSLHAASEKSQWLANGGVHLVKPELLRASKWRRGDSLSLEEEIMPTLLDGGARFYGHECKGRFIDIGVPEDYFRSAAMLANGRDEFHVPPAHPEDSTRID